MGQKLEVFEAKDAVQHNIVHVHCDAHNVVFKALQKEYPKMKVLTFHPSNHCGIAGCVVYVTGPCDVCACARIPFVPMTTK